MKMDLLNADGLDESIVNQYSGCCGIAFNGEENSNADAKSNVDYGQIATQAVQLGTQVAGAVQASKESQAGAGVSKKELKSVCGRRPLLKKKRGEWQKCADSYIATKQGATTDKAPSSADVQNQINALKVANADKAQKEKFLGMPRTVGITVAVLGGIALLVGGVVLIKKMNK